MNLDQKFKEKPDFKLEWMKEDMSYNEEKKKYVEVTMKQNTTID